jgi:hypothetical protein
MSGREAKGATFLAARMLAGEADPTELLFRGGIAEKPFSVGRGGSWKVIAPGVEGVHAYLFFDGQQLWVLGADRENWPRLQGEEVHEAWVRVHAPSVLTMGEARVIFESFSPLRNTNVRPERPASGADDHAKTTLLRREEEPKTTLLRREDEDDAKTTFLRREDEDDAKTTFLRREDEDDAKTTFLRREEEPKTTHPRREADAKTTFPAHRRGKQAGPDQVTEAGRRRNSPPVVELSADDLEDVAPASAPTSDSTRGPTGTAATSRTTRQRRLALGVAALALLGVVAVRTTMRRHGHRAHPAGTSRPMAQVHAPAHAPTTAAPTEARQAEPVPASSGTPIAPAPPRVAVVRAEKGKSVERRAADAVTEGDDNGALALYEELAHAQPDRPVFVEARRILLAKMREPRR